MLLLQFDELFLAIPSCSNLTEFFFKRQTVCFPSGYNDLYFNSTFVCKIVKVSVQDQLSLLKLFFGILPCTLRDTNSRNNCNLCKMTLFRENKVG